MASLVLLMILAAAGITALLINPPWSTHHVTVETVIMPGATTDPSASVPPHVATAPLAPDPRSLTPAPAPQAPISSDLFPRTVDQSFARFSASLPGRVQIAVAPLGAGAVQTLGGDAPAHGWSTTKIPVLVGLLRSRAPNGLTTHEQSLAQAAVTASDNQSVLDLFADLEHAQGGLAGASDYIQGVLRQSGDQQTVVATAPPPPGAVSTFGQTEWAPTEATKFFRALGRGCLLPPAQSAYVIGLMENIVAGESWGLGSGGFAVHVAFKGGWGPEPSGSYLVRQSGIIAPGSTKGVAVSIVAYPSGRGDTFAAGTQMLTQTARWLHSELRLVPHPTADCSTG